MPAHHRPTPRLNTRMARRCLRCDHACTTSERDIRLCEVCHKAAADAATPEYEHMVNDHAMRGQPEGNS